MVGRAQFKLLIKLGLSQTQCQPIETQKLFVGSIELGIAWTSNLSSQLILSKQLISYMGYPIYKLQKPCLIQAIS